VTDETRTIFQPGDDPDDAHDPRRDVDSDRTLDVPSDPDATVGGPDEDLETTPPRPQPAPESEDPDRIGPYRLIRPIGEGGMGEVFQAEQLYPLRRTVALKIVKKGMDTAEFVSRFESERQALALMDHPGIARVFDAGATPLGRPYFVMEYVDGVPLTEFCDEQGLDLQQRLELFIHICEGVQHAHQKAIIHRDLKPSNVLITEVDGQPQPKIIDFGVAKAMDRDLTENTMRTGMGQVLGTPAYMSPEQADFDAQNVDTRADVYALGVILYELIAGERPFAKKELESAGFKEALRMIREDDPPRPSDRYDTLAENRDTVAMCRGTDTSSLRRKLRGDLDWITMKALEKEPARRYAAASALAQDVQRYLDFEPVSAGPPTVRYRAGKFIRRNRAGVVTGLLVTVALVLGVTGTTIGLIRAVEAERIASEEARTATRVTDFLVDLFEVSDPDESRGETVTARELLEQGGDRIEKELADEPRVRSRLMTTIGKVYRNLGLYTAALPYLESAVDVRRLQEGSGTDLAISLAELGDLYIKLARFGEAATILEEALTVIGGDNDPNQLIMAESLHDLANVYRRQGHYDEAEPLYLRAREIRVQVLGAQDPAVAATDNSMAALYWNRGDYAQAERRYLNAMAIWDAAHGRDHSDVAKVRNNLALLYHQTDRFKDAELLYLEAIPIYERILGPEHPRLGLAINNLALVLHDQERYDEAETYYLRSLAIAEQAYEPPHPQLARIINNLGNLARDRERYDEAQELYRRALDIRIAVFGDEHPAVAWSLRDLGVLQDRRGDPEASLPYLEQAYSIFAAVNGTDHPELAEIMESWAEALEHAGNTVKAADIRARAAVIKDGDQNATP